MFCLEEGPHHHVLDPGNGGQLAEDDQAKELAFSWSRLAKLEEAGTVYRLQGEGPKRGRDCHMMSHDYMWVARRN